MHAYTFGAILPERVNTSAVYRNLGDGANSAQPPQLLDRMRQVLRTKNDAYSTE